MQMRKIFDYSFLVKELLPPELLNVTNAIIELKTLENIRKENFSNIFRSLEQSAKIMSVQSSNEIEGIVTSEQRLIRIVSKNEAPITHDEAEIAGYRDALNLIHTSHEEMNITEKQILQLHKIMLSYTTAKSGVYAISAFVLQRTGQAFCIYQQQESFKKIQNRSQCFGKSIADFKKRNSKFIAGCKPNNNRSGFSNNVERRAYQKNRDGKEYEVCGERQWQAKIKS